MSLFGKLTNRFLAPFGVRITKVNPALERLTESEYDYLNILESKKIDLILDVGACVGQYGQWLRKLGYSNRIYSFEPYSASYNELKVVSTKDSNWQVHDRLALGDKESVLELNVYNLRGCNSLLEADTLKNYLPSLDLNSKEEVAVSRLDSLNIPNLNASEGILLKADVQGYERFVVEGAEGLLNQIRLIHLEVSFDSVYKGESNFLSIVNYLNEKDFKLIYIFPELKDKSGKMIQANAIFSNSAL
jgi:FkbM family methyltransferase